ncbi:MAG TPA: thioredoxin-dependent thiol peroxidase [Arenimonas sp.]|nr:thioredoxin-dependent thiol peroxidase [Arenimonas sp.]HOZ04505.1 thioredoxin-dependent thiol peroxidase [Arenimonas sp.]HPO24266.1 thioredoxin-dependent thiol peroxidase [Arenimonas sp.]HPW32169.1 thioredoxin-dependent thiol peroxidase [Arenimonas sp.]
MLTIGSTAPGFNLKTESGKTVSSASLKGQRFVLYFYPKDDTPGCTKEACSFRDNLPAFNKLKVPVFGISADDEKAHGKFVTKYQLNFSLLADPEHKTCDAFGTWVEKSMYGKKYFGIQRSTFIISDKGKIEHVWEKVSPEGHAEEVLAFLSGESSTKISPVKKATAKKVIAKKAVVKKTAAKKAPAKKTAAKKSKA